MPSHRLVLLMTAALCLLATAAGAEEGILDYDSRVELARDGSMRVTETILVRAENQAIRHGIYRKFPVRELRWGLRHDIPFEVQSVQRNGHEEPYHLEDQEGHVYVYIGSKDRLVEPGEHEYRLVYTTSDHLAHGETSDRLTWNVTGNEWEFPIQRATATVLLPEAVEKVTATDFWTGPRGSTEKHADTQSVGPAGTIFRTTRPLPPGHGLTVRVEWPAGVMEPAPGALDILFRDNPGLLIALLGLVGVVIYYGIAWVRRGVDPMAAPLRPQNTPPEGLSAAAARYVWKMGYDNRTFSAAVVQMATLGYLRIVQPDDSDYVLERADGAADDLPADTRDAARELLEQHNSVPLERSHRSTISAAMDKLEEHLQDSYKGSYFVLNRRLFAGGVILSALVALLSVLAYDLGPSVFLLVWLTFWTVAVVALLHQVASTWKQALSGRPLMIFGALFITAFTLPFLAGEVLALGLLGSVTAPLLIPALVGLGVVNVVFLRLLKAPTQEGRAVLDELEGYRAFLRSEMNRAGAGGERSRELFEQHLAYAIALDAEERWAEQFEDDLGESLQTSSGIHHWYRSPHSGALAPAVVASSLSSSLSSALSSATTSSSSGSGSGGSSGGGGGGGGGGGW
jgi:uncharacterized membrane protein YgcG